MTHLTNAFPLTVPEIVATVYSIDPQPRSDIYSTLGYLEGVVERSIDGKAQKWTRPGTDDWFIAVVGASEQKTIEESGTTLEHAASDVLDISYYWDKMALQRAINNSLNWFLQNYQDFWYHDGRNALYQGSPRTHVGEYDVYTGFWTRVAFHDVPQLVVETKTTFIGETLAEKLEDLGTKRTEREYGGQNFMLDRPTPTNCQFHGVSKGKTVSDPTIEYNGESISVIEFARREYGDEWAGKIDPEEPLVQIRFGNSDPYDAAPSLLRSSPHQLEPYMTGEAALSAKERFGATMDFIDSFEYIQIEGERVDVQKSLIEPDPQGTFSYPPLRFGGGEVVSEGAENAVSRGQEVHPGNWRWIVKDYLEEFGFCHSQTKKLDIALVHPSGFSEAAEGLYRNVRGTLNAIGSVELSRSPHPICYEDENEFDEWVSEFGGDVHGVLGVLDDDDRKYYEIIERFDGLPTQFIQRSNVQGEGRVDSDVLFNTAIGLAVKLGDVPFAMDEPLSSDIIMGLSVAGYEFTNAAAVMLDGKTGELLFQTEQPLSRGQSTVSDEHVITRIVESGISTVSDSIDRSIDSMTIHGNGRFGDEEIDTLWEVFERLEDRGLPASGFEWDAIEVLDNHPYRLFKNRGDAPSTGAYAELDADTILVTTFGEPQIHQGTPKPLLCHRESGNRSVDMVDIGKDVFDLSFLNWGSPTMKMKSTVSIQIPKKLNEILEKTTRVRYPPF